MTWRLGPYWVEDRPFARGASAEVFRARDRRDGGVVAVKVLRLVALDPEVRDRAEKEADHAALDHPHVARVLERLVDERRQLVGLVMDLAEGGDLRMALSGPNPPTPAEMLDLTDDILAGLGALHAAGVIHRDVKPENVLLQAVDGRRRARLGDLGIAREVDRTRSTGSVLGTDLYIAPEVHEGVTPSVSSDIWAVGYVLYEGLFGGPPHATSATAYQAIGRLRAAGPDRPPAVPDEVWDVVARLLAPSPGDRPASSAAARALIEPLRRVLAVETSTTTSTVPAPAQARIDTPLAPERPAARPPRPLMRPRPRPTGRRHLRGLPAAGAIAAIVLTVVATLNSVRTRSETPAPPEPIAAVRSLTPLSPQAPGVVPTQYQWRVRGGVLTGHLAVTNPTSASTAATLIPELFPTGASRDGRLSFSGPATIIERQIDGSTLLQLAIPALAPGESHDVRFTVTLPARGSADQVLAALRRERDEAIARHALLRSGAPTLTSLEIAGPGAALSVGEQAPLGIVGRLESGEPAPPALLDGLRWTVVEGSDVIELGDASITARRAGPAVILASVGAVEARLEVTVLAPPAKTPAAKPRRSRTTTPQTIIVEEQHENPPPPHETFLVLGPRESRRGRGA